MTVLAANPRLRDQVWTLVACEDCGRPFRLIARQARRLLRGERSAKCGFCAYRVELVVLDEHRRFWLEQFSLAEIVEMAEAAWGMRPWSVEWRTGFTFAPSMMEDAA